MQVNLNPQKISMTTIKHEQGLELAKRACKGTVYVNLKYTPINWKSLAELTAYYNQEHPNLRNEAQEAITDQCKQKYPKQYKAASRWLNDCLVEAWQAEALEEYYNQTSPSSNK